MDRSCRYSERQHKHYPVRTATGKVVLTTEFLEFREQLQCNKVLNEPLQLTRSHFALADTYRQQQSGHNFGDRCQSVLCVL